MPNTKETVRALIRAFNVNNYGPAAIETNLTLQSKGREDYVVVSFSRNVSRSQCVKYLKDVRRKIVHEFYDIKEDTELDTIELIFDVQSFPFKIGEEELSEKQGGFEFVASVDPGVIYNLKSHLAASLAKDVLADMPICSMSIKAPNKEDYLWQGEFPNKKLRKQFEDEFLSRVKKRYKNVPGKLLRIEGNNVYIKDVFNDVRFIDSITQYTACLIGMGLQADSKDYRKAKVFKDLIMQFVGQSTEIMIAGFICASPLGRREASILIPVILDGRKPRILTYEEAFKINYAFDGAVLYNIFKETQATIRIDEDEKWVYGINFSKQEISHCVINKIIESSLINKDYELTIDPELHFRALSPSPDKHLPNGHSYDGEDSPSSSLDGIDSPRQGTTLSSPLLLRSVEAKEKVLWSFIRYLPLEKNEKSGAEIYSILSSFCDRDGLYSEFHLSREQKNEMEERWRSLLHQFEESLSASSEELAGLTLGGPRCRNSVVSKDSAYYTESPTSRRSSFGSVESSDEGDFSRNSLQYASSISKSSTESSVSSNASVDTVIEVEEDSSLELSESSPSRSASSEPPEKKSGRFSLFRRKSSGSKSTLTSPTHDPGLPNGDIYDENMPGSSAKLSQMELESAQSDQGKELRGFPDENRKKGGYSII